MGRYLIFVVSGRVSIIVILPSVSAQSSVFTIGDPKMLSTISRTPHDTATTFHTALFLIKIYATTPAIIIATVSIKNGKVR
jgi:hypothetical protein